MTLLNIKKSFHILCLCMLLSFLSSENVLANKELPMQTGDTFPDFLLNVPLYPEDKKYLGLSGKKSYTLKNIVSDFLLVEIFSIYCPVCQKHAEKFNSLHKLIEEDINIRKKIKMIAIGAGNNQKEIEYFKNYYRINFPCMSDPAYKIHKALKEPRTPILFLVDKRSLPYTKLCVLDFNKDPETLIQDIKKELRNSKPQK